MRILLGVHQFFPTHYTGTERYVLNLAKQLQRMGHYVKVLTYAFNEKSSFEGNFSQNLLYREYSYEGVPVISIRHKSQHDDLYFVFDFMDIEIYNATKKIIEKGNFDIYHCAHPLRIGSSLKAAKDMNLKVVFMLTDYFMMCPMGIMLRTDNTLCDGPDNGNNCLKYCFTNVSKDRMQNRIYHSLNLIECSDILLSPSQFLIAAYDFTGFIPSSRFQLSRHGSDYSKIQKLPSKPPKDIITFGYIGTVQYHKGVHIMVDGFKRVKNPKIRLQIWGGCFNEVEYQKKIKDTAKNDNRVELKGQYNFNHIGKILENIDVVIVPSIWYENAPLTISTSLAYGIPVLVSDIGGMSEAIMDGKNGLAFKVGDPNDLADKIRLLSEDPRLIDNLKKTLQYPIRIEEEAFNTELVYKNLLFDGFKNSNNL